MTESFPGKNLIKHLIVLFFLCALIFPCLPASASMLKRMKKSKLPWHIQADHLSYNNKKKIYYADGNVRISSGNKIIRADKVVLETISHNAHLKGHVYIKVSRDWLKGEEGFFNLKEETGTVSIAKIFFYDQHVYINSAVIQKTGRDTYHLEHGTVTTCDGKHPDWLFKFSTMDVTLSGYGKARQVSFNVSKYPILYTPYLTFPVKRERKSGILFPSYGTSDLNGFEFELPLYWAINDHMDATFYPHYYKERGLMTGFEFRYKESPDSMGLLRFDYLSDHRSDRELKKFGYPRVEKERWWWRSKNNFTLPGQFRGRLDLDVASDKNYLREFDIGTSSWSTSNLTFLHMMDRGLRDDKSVLSRESNLYVTRDWEMSHLGFELRYWDNLDRRFDETQLQQLPRVDFNIAQKQLGETPFFYELDSEFMDYWRREGTRGQRFDIFPRLSLPFKWQNYFNIEPSIGTRGTFYITHADEPEDSEVSDNDFMTRGIVDCRLDITSNLQRIYDFQLGRLRGLRHTLRPEITYEYIPDIDQDRYPAYDQVDRISRQNRVVYGISNFFVGKYWLNNDDYSFPEIGRVKIFQSYDLRESPEIFHNSDRRPFSDITMEMDLNPCSHFSLSYDTGISPYDATWSGHELLVNMSDPRGDSLGVDYRQRPGDLDQVNVYGGVAVTKYLRFATRQHYSFRKDEFFTQSYSATIVKQCWTANVSFLDEASTQTWTFMFNLRGIGALGNETLNKVGTFK